MNFANYFFLQVVDFFENNLPIRTPVHSLTLLHILFLLKEKKRKEKDTLLGREKKKEKKKER